MQLEYQSLRKSFPSKWYRFSASDSANQARQQWLNLLHNSPTIKGVNPGLALISGHDTGLGAITTGQNQSIGERAVIGTATEVTTPEDERPTTELPPEEAVPNLQTERKIDRTILD